MTITQRILALLSLTSLFLLSSCGGGGSAGSSLFGCKSSSTTTCPGSGTPVSSLVVTLSSPTIDNSGTSTVTATVTALDANNNAVSGAAVTLAANGNGVVTVQGTLGSVTDSSGKLTASIGIGSDMSLRTITLTATSGATTSQPAQLTVVAAPTSSVPAKIAILASSSSVLTGGNAVMISAFVEDANNNALPSATVAFSADTGILSNVQTVTNASGVATASFSGGPDRSDRTATITVSSGSLSNTITLPISGTKLTLSGPTSAVLGTTVTMSVTATDSTNAVIPGISVTGTSSLGNKIVAAPSTTTNSSGTITFNYTATNSGADTITFNGAGYAVSPPQPLNISALNFSFISPTPSTTVPVNQAQPVAVQLFSGGAPQAGVPVTFATSGGSLSSTTATTDATGTAQTSVSSASAGPLLIQATVSVSGSSTTATLPLTIVGTTPAAITLQVNPTSLQPNLNGGATNQAQLQAKVTDAAGNPVPNITVNFTRVADPSGGTLQQVSAITNAVGLAQVNYIAGPVSTADNGVDLRASVASTPTIQSDAFLTVNGAALYIALGTGNTIRQVDSQTNAQDWVAYVTDSNGIAVPSVNLTIKGIPAYYRTGRLAWNAAANIWTYTAPIYQCRNEDQAGTGIYSPAEDDNGNGKLDPGNVIAVAPATIATSTAGLATITLTYAKSYAMWVGMNLTASATVAGTESSNTTQFTVPGLASDYTNQQVSPPGAVSPYGAMPTAKALATPGACVQIQ
ncbi:MAG: Ig-like domain-containing protein [Burkholderiales bacterium]|nr:Ig-like domain-containing protein [Burkholderiales bacterium]MDE1927354.1 Ig-like domain-containing protein [Burkholderiales bacterium]MDE2159738.1 Ig-like domain-containing protein [Burkholderiales bacterium]MDE2502708.1 Ig-like domain-containing protein [Burkholderiales bacterium]